MYTYSIITLKIARKINRNVDFPGFSKSFIRLSANPHRKLRLRVKCLSHRGSGSLHNRYLKKKKHHRFPDKQEVLRSSAVHDMPACGHAAASKSRYFHLSHAHQATGRLSGFPVWPDTAEQWLPTGQGVRLWYSDPLYASLKKF